MNTLLTFALQNERSDQFNDYNTLITGLGQANTAYRLTRYILKNEKPDLIINLGTAGSPTLSKGTICNPTVFNNRHEIIINNNLQIEKDTITFYGESIELHEKPIKLSSGLDFVTKTSEYKADCYDMEAYIIAKICYMENIRFCCIKYITDNVNESSEVDWKTAVKQAPLALREALDRAMEKMKWQHERES